MCELLVPTDAVVRVVPWSTTLVQVLYWPVVILLSVAFLTTLYHVSVPVRSPWIEDVPGALVALAMWVLGSFLLRIYLTSTVEGPMQMTVTSCGFWRTWSTTSLSDAGKW